MQSPLQISTFDTDDGQMVSHQKLFGSINPFLEFISARTAMLLYVQWEGAMELGPRAASILYFTLYFLGTNVHSIMFTISAPRYQYSIMLEVSQHCLQHFILKVFILQSKDSLVVVRNCHSLLESLQEFLYRRDFLKEKGIRRTPRSDLIKRQTYRKWKKSKKACS